MSDRPDQELTLGTLEQRLLGRGRQSAIGHFSQSGDFDGGNQFLSAGVDNLFQMPFWDDGVRDRLAAGESVILTCQGEENAYEVRLDPIRQDAELQSYVVTVSAQHQAHPATLQSNRQLQQFADAMPHVIWMALPSGQVEYVNSSYEHVFGRSSKELYERPDAWLDAIHDDDRNRVGALVHGLPHQHIRSFRIVRPDGEVRYVRDMCIPIREEDGEIGLIVGICEDVTEAEQSRERIHQQQAQLAQVIRNSTMGEMAAGIAHEINQPLSAMANYAAATINLLRREEEAPPVDMISEWMQRAGSEARRAGDIIRKLRLFVKRVEPQRTTCDLHQLIHEGIEIENAAGMRSAAEIDLQFAEGHPQVDGDPVQLQQVIINLLRNACDAVSDLPFGEREVRLETSLDETDAVITVCDNGPGLGEPEQVFEPFYTTKPHGMGMGLAVCRSIVKAHGGRLHADDTFDSGARLYFTLPLRVARSEARV